MYVTDSRRQKQKQRRNRLLALLALILFVALLIVRQPGLIPNPFQPTPTPTVSPANFLLTADVAYQEGRLADAISAYKDYLALTPDDGDTWAQLARLQIWAGDTAASLDSARQAYKLDEENPFNMAVLGWALDWNKDYDAAVKLAINAVDRDPQMAEARAYLSEIYADLGNWPRALEEAQEAVRLDPQSPEGHRALGYAFNVKGEYKKSIAAYDAAIQAAPQLARLYYEQGQNYVAEGDYDRAVEAYRRAIKANPNYAAAYDALGWAYYYEDDPERAIIELERAVALDPTMPEAWSHLGMALYRRQRYEDAVAPLSKGVELGADNEGYYFTLGLAYLYGEPRNCEQARIWFQRALDKNPTSQPALVGLQTCSD